MQARSRDRLDLFQSPQDFVKARSFVRFSMPAVFHQSVDGRRCAWGGRHAVAIFHFLASILGINRQSFIMRRRHKIHWLSSKVPSPTYSTVRTDAQVTFSAVIYLLKISKSTTKKLSVSQSVSQSVNQSVNQSINQSELFCSDEGLTLETSAP